MDSNRNRYMHGERNFTVISSQKHGNTITTATSANVNQDGGNQDGQLKSSSNIQQKDQQQTLQPVLPTSDGVNTSSRTLSRTKYHWSHALTLVGVLTASGAGTVLIIKNFLLSRLKSWIRNVVLDNNDELSKETNNKPTLAEEVMV
ncbi:hypothetical protein RYX36_022061 [Vicia faba]